MKGLDRIQDLIILFLLCTVFVDLLFFGLHRLPEAHRQVMAGAALLWFVCVLLRRNSDDDWAGQR